MSKKLIIIATSLMLIGVIIFVGVMIMLKWNFKNLTTDEYQTNNYVINENYENILVKTKTADVAFLPANDNTTKVICTELKKGKHSVKVENDTLIITDIDTRKWYEYIGFHFNKPKITVYLPKAEYNNLTINNTTGDVDIVKGFTFLNADISVTTGDIEMKNVIVKGKMTVKLTTGDVEFEDCDASEILVKVITGDVEGTLLSNKTFDVKTTTGKVDVPRSRPGGLCKMTTVTGNIDIDIKE